MKEAQLRSVTALSRCLYAISIKGMRLVGVWREIWLFGGFPREHVNLFCKLGVFLKSCPNCLQRSNYRDESGNYCTFQGHE